MPARCLPVLTLLCFATCGFAAEPAARKVDFTRDVRAILSENCFVCHGPDEKARKAELRLDLKADAFREREGITTIVPGKPEESELVARILSTDENEQMPPKSSGKKLTPAQIETLRLWVEQGATWSEHWAYLPPVKTAAPEVPAGAAARGEIDRFVLAALKAHKFEMAPEADRVTLIRRLSLDLLGLPPSPEEVQAFLNDKSPEAYEKLVDRLLASPHFGERLGMYWLDLVRYADTCGIHGDNHVNVDLYRDYVIDAFNSNMPFDRFTIEQIAGDLLEKPTTQQQIASGYNRMLMTTREGGAQAREYIAKYQADRVRNASAVWLGSTMGCCECHDHKYDPFLTRDFYRLASFFADIQEIPVGGQPETALPNPEQETQLAALTRRRDAVRQRFLADTPELVAARMAWESRTLAELPSLKPVWSAVKPEAVTEAGGTVFTVQDDASVLTSGPNPAKATYSVTLKTDETQITGFRLEALRHESLTEGRLSRANGNFVLTEVAVTSATGADAKAAPVKIASALADFEQSGFAVAAAIDGKPDTGWAVSGHTEIADRKAVFVFEKPLTGGPGTTLVVTLKHESQYAGHNIGRFRLSLTQIAKPSLSDSGLPEDVLAALQTDAAARTPEQTTRLAAYHRDIAPELAGLRAELAQAEAALATLKNSFRPTLVSTAIAPRMVRILPRGNWLDETGEVVTPGTPAFLPQINSTDRASRRELANWLVSRDNPLTARVFVNRLWKLFFGQGIVKSLEDFGSQGTPPTHPQLLDNLAVEFMEEGWDVKRMVKAMVMSAAYRQSSAATADQLQRDPYNDWLSHQARFRIDAEFVRDTALTLSGLIVHRVGGPSVRPYQPPGYWSHLNFPKREYQVDSGEDVYRRGLYTYWCRTFLHPSLRAFDAPSREECTVQRPRSNTPLQALVLLNDPIYVEAARAFAARIVKQGGDTPQSRLDYAFQVAMSRAPRPEEVRILAPLYERHKAQFVEDEAARRALLSVGTAPPAKGMDEAELAAWTSVARTILNLHETITRP